MALQEKSRTCVVYFVKTRKNRSNKGKLKVVCLETTVTNNNMMMKSILNIKTCPKFRLLKIIKLKIPLINKLQRAQSMESTFKWLAQILKSKTNSQVALKSKSIWQWNGKRNYVTMPWNLLNMVNYTVLLNIQTDLMKILQGTFLTKWLRV